MTSRFSSAHDNESGFTLVELLVVIAIIAILTAIAVPSFLSQRAKANDASVRADMKSVVTTIETALIDRAGVVDVTSSGNTASVTIDGTPAGTSKLSKGVTVVSADEGNTTTRYTLLGSHTGGTGDIWYDSANGGFVTAEPTTAP